MESSRHTVPQLIRYLIAAVIFVSLSLALTAQIPSVEPSADESFGTTIVLQKKIHDDAQKSFDGESSFDALQAAVETIAAGPEASFSTSHYLAASYLAAFINPPSRAPPHAL